MEKELFELPPKYGGLGIINTSRLSDCEYFNSRIIARKDQNSSKTNI